MSREKTTFISSTGSTIAAAVDMPEQAPRAVAVFCHCFTCNKDLPIAVHLGRTLSAAGIVLVRFDLPGLGESPGEFAESTLSRNIADTLAVVTQAEQRWGSVKLLIGHSFGGPTALLTAAKLADVRAVATIAAPSCPTHVRHFFADTEFDENGVGEIAVAGRRFKINRQFDEDLGVHEMTRMVGNLGKALGVFHSPVDRIVGIENAAEIYAAAKHPKSFISLDRADHLVSDAATAQYLGRMISSWADYYLTEPGR